MLPGSRWSLRRLVTVATTTVAVGAVLSLLLLVVLVPRPTTPIRHPRHDPTPEPPTYNTLSSGHDKVTEGKKTVPGDMEYIPGWPYGVKINQPDMCENNEVYLLNAVISNPSQIYHREMIRKMWGRESIARRLRLKTVFIVGAVPSAVTQRHLQRESDQHRDIIQFDFLETRKNLTIKSLAAVHWFRAFCSNATWVLKCDVDAYINFWALRDVLTAAENTSDAVCARSMSRSVCREVTEEGCLPHYVVHPRDYYPSVYPPYCQGYAYVLHRRLADRMLKVDGQRTDAPFWLEDVYVTGLLLRDLHPRWLDVRRRSQVVPMSVRPEYHDGTMLFIHDLEGQIGQGATNYVWLKTLQHYNVTT